MEINSAVLPLAIWALGQEMLLELINAGLISRSQAKDLLDRAIARLQPDSGKIASDASIFLGEIRDAL